MSLPVLFAAEDRINPASAKVASTVDVGKVVFDTGVSIYQNAGRLSGY